MSGCSLTLATLSLSRRERDAESFSLREKGGESVARGPKAGARSKSQPI